MVISVIKLHITVVQVVILCLTNDHNLLDVNDCTNVYSGVAVLM